MPGLRPRATSPLLPPRPSPCKRLSASAGAVGIVESSLVPSLVRKLTVEQEDIQELILDTLAGCLQVEAFEALVSGAVRILKEKLHHPSVGIRSRVAQALMAIR